MKKRKLKKTNAINVLKNRERKALKRKKLKKLMNNIAKRCEHCGTEKDLIKNASITSYIICQNCYDNIMVDKIIAGNKKKRIDSIKIFFCENCMTTR